jgi:metal-dependent amidase/aminoacylase/carboxypeptidase family protein
LPPQMNMPKRLGVPDYEAKDAYETKDGSLASVVGELADYKDAIANFDDLSDVADKFDAAVAEDNSNDVLDTAQEFVDLLQQAMDDTDDAEASDALSSAAEDFGDLLQTLPSSADIDGSDDGDQGKADPVSFTISTKDLQAMYGATMDHGLSRG